MRTLRRLVEGIKARNLAAVATFVDFKKSFDSANRKKLFDILKPYGIPVSMYHNTESLLN